MIKHIVFSFVLFFTFIVPTQAVAEGNTTKPAAATITKEDSVAEAMKLLNEMNLKSVYENAVKNSTIRLVNANPKFKSVEGKIKSFYSKYIGWDGMKKDLAKLYAKYYTVSELNEITNFYKTNTGKKVLATMGKLSYDGQMITQNRLKPHLDELKKILDDAAAAPKKTAVKKEHSKKADTKKTETKK